MQRTILRNMIRINLKKSEIPRPGKHISDALQSLRGTKFVPYRGKNGKKMHREMKLREEEKKFKFKKEAPKKKKKPVVAK